MLTHFSKSMVSRQLLTKTSMAASNKGLTSSLNRGFNRFGAFRASQALNKPASLDNFVNGTSAVYVDQLYDEWRADPSRVHPSWRAYFENEEAGVAEPF